MQNNAAITFSLVYLGQQDSGATQEEFIHAAFVPTCRRSNIKPPLLLPTGPGGLETTSEVLGVAAEPVASTSAWPPVRPGGCA